MAQLALAGLRILDLTQVAVGPYATLLLGFMGAEVIKVESCARMDISRGAARPRPGGEGLYPGGDPGERPWNRTGHYVHRNGNKRSLTLDLATARGKELFLQLVSICDVLIENYRASVMDRLGLGYDVVSGVNPRLIYIKISSQGATGPEKEYASLGSTLEQTAGLASITGYSDGKPLMTNETYPDPVVGMLAVGALMAALRRRRKTVDYALTGRVAQPLGNRHPLRVPQGVYPCQGETCGWPSPWGLTRNGTACAALSVSRPWPRIRASPRSSLAARTRRSSIACSRPGRKRTSTMRRCTCCRRTGYRLGQC